jgi:two-component system response regulator (stage 0 sporulation protein F)
MSHILIVDDDQRIVQLLGDCFKHAYTVEVAMNAGEALAIVQRQHPDLVLLDVMLPGVSGMHLLKELKRIDSKIAVVMVTGSDSVGLAAEAVEHGAAAFVRKPFDLVHLDRLVTEVLAKSGTGDAPPVEVRHPGGWRVADDDEITDKIRVLMDAGALPAGEVSSRRVGLVSARTCDACNNAIRPTERAIELEFWKTIVVNLHARCAKLYEAELRRRTP